MAAEADSGSGGLGCRTMLTAVGTLLVFAVGAVAIGLGLILGEDPSPLAETFGLALYAAGAPVSGVFAVIAGDLPLTLYLDLVVWVVGGAAITKLAERGRPLALLLVTAMALALAFGLVVSTLIELA